MTQLLSKIKVCQQCFCKIVSLLICEDAEGGEFGLAVAAGLCCFGFGPVFGAGLDPVCAALALFENIPFCFDWLAAEDCGFTFAAAGFLLAAGSGLTDRAALAFFENTLP